MFWDSQDFRLLGVRSTILILHGLVMAGVQFYLPVPIVHTLNCSGALFVFIIQYMLDGVKITKNQTIYAGVAFLGIIISANGRELYKLIDKNYEFTSSF